MSLLTSTCHVTAYIDRIADEWMSLDDEVLRLDDEEVAVETFRHQIVGEQLTQREVDAHRAHQSAAGEHRK